MKKTIAILFILIPLFSFSQTVEDSHRIFNYILKEQLGLGNTDKVDTVIIIKKVIDSDYKLYFIDELEEQLKQTDSLFLWTPGVISDLDFRKSLINEPDIFIAMKGYNNNFSGKPKIKLKFLEDKKLFYYLISSRKFKRFFRSKEFGVRKGWEKIIKEYKAICVVSFSKVNYYKDFAVVYWDYRCGSLCGRGNISIYKKVNEKWELMKTFNLWMS